MTVSAVTRLTLAASALAILACLPRRTPTSVRADPIRCRWAVPVQVLQRAADTVYLAWNVPTPLPDTWQPSDAPAVVQMQRGARRTLRAAGLSADPRVLVERQVRYWASRPTPVERLEAANGRAVLAGHAGTLRPIGCLEALLLEAQLGRFPATGARSEMHAFVLTRVASAALAQHPAQLVYFAASGAPWPPRPGLLLDLIAAREAEGWQLAADVHNHPFYFDHLGTGSAGQPFGDIAGATAPSTSDVQFYRFLRDRLGLGAAWLTNGFTTLVVPAAALDQLHDRSEAPRALGTPGS